MVRRKSPFDIFRDFDEIFNEMIREMEKSSIADFSGRPFVYGFSWSQRPGEEPEIREFGNIYPGEGRIEIGERRPLVDVFDTDDAVQVVAEMPGIEKEDVDLNIEDRKLEIRAVHGDKRYNEVVELPVDVESDSAKATYRNGVLEVTIRKAKQSKNKKKINIE